MKIDFITKRDQEELPLAHGGRRVVHVFEAKAVRAINAALGAGRPLLVRGEPGTGKSQLALAAAAALERSFVSKVLDARTEVGELFYTTDAVARLGLAQTLGALGARLEGQVGIDELLKELDERHFVSPGPLWWGFDPAGAEQQAQEMDGPRPDWPERAAKGVVVLLDEIDKADPSVPNGLLEALGSARFAGLKGRIEQTGVPPLVIVTTNEERALPDAFLRRCLVLHLALPEGAELESFLVARGRAHFPACAPAVLKRAAELLITDRNEWRRRQLSAPGQAEFLDLVRAVLAERSDVKGQLELVEQIAEFALKKHGLTEQT